ncbi:hypothetical protein AQUCO_03000258v1 [Aquilegia coerulea]|uniref:Uncharacterized protein n=1 Tax=Aquilegia coerulea TaxID=218851 RepID=A0A2G5D213_AQUCA|nr:hypothetical protein AQUCO_03000258v1 [Aquilegia coerulea]
MKKGGNQRPGQRQNVNAENKDQDEDSLLLFRDMQKRDKERIISLLQPIQTDDMESNSGNYPLYRIPSAKKFGFDFLHESDKNDYDWLKTPPATPLFASLEMEAGAPELVLQRELPILAHLSRVRIPQDVPKMNSLLKSPNPKAKVPLPSLAQRTRTNATSSWPTDTTSISGPVVSIPDANERLTTLAISKDLENTTEVPFNLPETTNVDVSARVSPPKRTVTSNGFSDETPPNLITNRASSNLRGRPTNPSIQRQPVDQHDSNSVPSTNRSSSTSRDPIQSRRQSCSPSMSRGRKTELAKQEKGGDPTTMNAQKKNQSENGSLAFGSSMVEKVMNARKSISQESERKPRFASTTTNDNSGFGRFVSRSSVDMAARHKNMRNYSKSNKFQFP